MISIGLIGANALVLSPIATEVAGDLGLSQTADIMTAAAGYGVSVAVSALVLAPLADRFGADTIMRQAILLITLAMGLSAAAPNVAFLIGAQALAGIGVGMALPAIYTMAAVISAPGEEARTIGKVITGWTLSMVGGVSLSAFVADAFGWRAVFAILGTSLFCVLLVQYLRPLPAAPKSGKITSPIGAMRVPGIFSALFSVAMIGTGFYGIYNYLGTWLTDHLGLTTSSTGWFTLSYGLGFAVAMLGDPWLDRLGPRRGLMIVFSALTVFYVSAAFTTHHAVWLCLSMAAWGVLQHLGLNLTVNRLTRLDHAQRGAIMGLNSAVMYLSVFGATLLYRPLFDGWGLIACILASAILAMFGAIEALASRQQGKGLETAKAT